MTEIAKYFSSDRKYSWHRLLPSTCIIYTHLVLMGPVEKPSQYKTTSENTFHSKSERKKNLFVPRPLSVSGTKIHQN